MRLLLLASWIAVLTVLTGCDGIVARENLGANDAPQTVTLKDLPDCRLCHSYPVLTGQHRKHLFEVSPTSFPNGQITCMDCHFGSIHSKKIQNEWGDTVHHPSLAHVDSSYDNESFAQIQSRIQQWFGKRGDSTRLLSLRTMGKHANGVVDVQFAPENASDPSITPSYDKATGKCTACHGPGEEPGTYKW